MQFAKQNGDKSSSLTISTPSQVSINRLGNFYDSVGIDFMGENSRTYSNLPQRPSGKFEITHIDRVKKIISGVFECTLYPTDGSTDSVRITEGRFDFTYDLCRCNE